MASLEEEITSRAETRMIAFTLNTTLLTILLIVLLAGDCKARQDEAYQETVRSCISAGWNPSSCRGPYGF